MQTTPSSCHLPALSPVANNEGRTLKNCWHRLAYAHFPDRGADDLTHPTARTATRQRFTGLPRRTGRGGEATEYSSRWPVTPLT